MRRIPPAALLLALIAAPALADGSNIAPDHKNSWCGNTGWMNWRDAGNGVQGVRCNGAVLSGFVWAENIGWVNLGSTATLNGSLWHQNQNGADFGVNVNFQTGASELYLWGYAWGANVGWINFAVGDATGGVGAAYLDAATRRLRGYIWGENIGWVSLDDANIYVGLTCQSDVDDGSGTGQPDGGVGVEDLLFYLGLYDAGDLRADVDNGAITGIPDMGVGIEDLLYFLSRYDSGC